MYWYVVRSQYNIAYLMFTELFLDSCDLISYWFLYFNDLLRFQQPREDIL